LRKLFAHLDFHCNPESDPCARKMDRPFPRCENCRVYVFADRFMGPTFQKQILGGVNQNPHILVVDSVGCQYRCWFCYARDILEAAEPVSPYSGWKDYKWMSPQEIAACTECKLTVKYGKIKTKRPFARFRITGGEPLFATKSTIADSNIENPIEAAMDFWLETLRNLNELVRKLQADKKIEILTYDEFVKRERTVNDQISTWLTQSPEKMEIRFDTNGQLFSISSNYTENFVKSAFKLHENGELDSICVNIDYSLKGPTPIEFEWSQSRSLPVDVAKFQEPFDLTDQPQYLGIKNLNHWLREAYTKDKAFEQSLRLDVERGINFTDTSKYGTRKLAVLYDSNALDWDAFAKRANIEFSEVNNPIQILGQAPYSKYIKDHLEMGAEVQIIDPHTKATILKFEPFPDDPKEADEYERKIRENLEKANKVITDGVSKAKTTGKLGAQVVIRPIKKRLIKTSSRQKKLDSF
jgi:organic radical activating enzyme